MGKSLKEQRRSEFKRYKEDVKNEGKPFFPYAIFHDTVMSLVVVVVIIGLAVVWHETADGTEAGILGPWYTDKADPGTIDFIPRPDWFFYFLFYLLRIFKWPSTVVLGTVGIPTLLMILAIGLPFYDRRPERRPGRRPVAMVTAILVVISMGVLTWKGATAKEALGSELIRDGVPQEWAGEQGFAGNTAAEAGAKLFAQAGCMNCHTYLGAAARTRGRPTSPRSGPASRRRHVQGLPLEPRAFGNKVMSSYSFLGDENLTNLGTFLNASKGPQTSRRGSGTQPAGRSRRSRAQPDTLRHARLPRDHRCFGRAVREGDPRRARRRRRRDRRVRLERRDRGRRHRALRRPEPLP